MQLTRLVTHVDIVSEFVEISVYLNTSTLSIEERDLLELLLEIIFECPIERQYKHFCAEVLTQHRKWTTCVP